MEKLIFVSGKAYYDLIIRRDEKVKDKSLELDQVALVRIEELCPFPTHEILEELEKFPNAKSKD